MGILDKIKSKVKSNIEYRRELTDAVKNRINDRKESVKKNIKMRIAEPERYKNLKREQRHVALDREIEMRKKETALSELNARKSRADWRTQNPIVSDRAMHSKRKGSKPSSNNRSYQPQPSYSQPTFNPARVDPGEFMGMGGFGNGNSNGKKKKKGGDPFDMFSGFP
jgi:hypothetical protein